MTHRLSVTFPQKGYCLFSDFIPGGVGHITPTRHHSAKLLLYIAHNALLHRHRLASAWPNIRAPDTARLVTYTAGLNIQLPLREGEKKKNSNSFSGIQEHIFDWFSGVEYKGHEIHSAHTWPQELSHISGEKTPKTESEDVSMACQ